MIVAVLFLLVVGVERLLASERWPRLAPARRVWRRWTPKAIAYVRSAPGTYAYLFVLLVTTWVLQTSSSRIANQLLLERSTNLHQLARDPLRVLFSSAFWVSSRLELVGWLALFSVLVAQVERWVGTARTALVFFAGHVGATLLTALGLWVALRYELIESSVVNQKDVGVSYGFAAVAAVLAYRFRGRPQKLYVAVLVAYVGVSLAVDHSFSNWGHLAALAIGFAWYPIVRRRRARVTSGRQLPRGVSCPYHGVPPAARPRGAPRVCRHHRGAPAGAALTSERMMLDMKIAFIGVGQLGVHLAGSLLRAGYELTVCDLDRQAAEGLLALGATWAETPAAAAADSAVVITCLPSPGSVAEVVNGEHGILRSFRPGGVWIDMSTNERHVLEALAAAAAEHGIATLEAPVSGNLPGAAAGEILVMVGGDRAVFEAQRPVLEAIGNPVFHVGELGKATVIKLITNMLAFVHLVACGEALMLAKQGGIDLAQAYEIIRASSGNSVIHETNGQLILNGSYNIGFTLELALKDFGFIDALGQELGVPLDLASVTRQTFLRAKSEYGGDAWMTKVVKLLEDAVGTDLRADGFPAMLGG